MDNQYWTREEREALAGDIQGWVASVSIEKDEARRILATVEAQSQALRDALEVIRECGTERAMQDFELARLDKADALLAALERGLRCR